MSQAKPDRKVFTDEQNDALRVALRDVRRRRHYSQQALGQLLGIEQQNVGRLLNSEAEGFSYKSATRLCRLTGFAGVDSFFKAKGVALAIEPQAKAG